MKIFVAHSKDTEKSVATVKTHIKHLAELLLPDTALEVRSFEDIDRSSNLSRIQQRIDPWIDGADALIAVFGKHTKRGEGTIGEIDLFRKRIQNPNRLFVLTEGKPSDVLRCKLDERNIRPFVSFRPEDLHRHCCTVAGNLFRRVESFEAGTRADTEFSPDQVLRAIDDYDHLIVASRTAFRWLAYPDDVRLRESVISAIRRKGTYLSFVVQDPFDLAFLPNATKIGSDWAMSYESFATLMQSIERENIDASRLQFLVTRSAILHSRVVLRHWDPSRGCLDFRWLVYDFARPTDQLDGGKPFIVVRDESLARSIIGETDAICRNAVPVEALNVLYPQRDQERQLIESIQGLETDRSSYSRVRHGQHHRLVRHMAEWEKSDVLPPPISIQLLLTYRCQTQCPMCSYYRLGKHASKELTLGEVRELLGEIRALGTRAVLLSGGEPLLRSDIVDILGECRLHGLGVGILTSGNFCTDARDPMALRVCDAVAATASWVQVSIDSFKECSPEAYLRDRGSYANACTFIEEVRSRGLKELHVSCTVQKQNIAELAHPATYDRLLQEIPGVFFRFKFAHGAWGKSDFLISEPELNQIKRTWESVVKSESVGERTNIPEMLRIIESRIARDGILSGEPVAHLVTSAGLAGQLCRALRTTMLIDACGDVYPCCYLYNDNSADWSERAGFRVGSFRQESGGSVHNGRLERIWRGPEFAAIRNRSLPLSRGACNRCTRHYRQNLFLAQLDPLLQDCTRLPPRLALDDPRDERIEPLWL